MLQGDINIARDLGAVRDGLDQLIRPMRRVGVKQANPEITGQGIQFAQEGADGRGAGRERLYGRVEPFGCGDGAVAVRTQVHAVISRVLRDQVQLLDAVGDEGLGLDHEIQLWTAAMRATNAGDDAEAAWMVAPFGDLDVGKVARRQPKARSGVVGDVAGASRDYG